MSLPDIWGSAAVVPFGPCERIPDSDSRDVAFSGAFHAKTALPNPRDRSGPSLSAGRVRGGFLSMTG